MKHSRAVAARTDGGATGALWTPADVLRSGLLIAVGLVVWAIGWHRVSGRPSMETQLAPLNLAVIGAIAVGVGQALWFGVARRRVDNRRRQLLHVSPAVLDGAVRRAGTAALHGLEEAEPHSFVGSERFYHRPNCPMSAGRTWESASRGDHEASGRVPCGVCAP